MVFEQLLDTDRVKKHPLFIVLLCFFYVLVAYGIAFLFFPHHVSVVSIFTLTLLLIPSLNHLLFSEEGIERRAGISHFLKNHKSFFKVFGFAFLGVFIGLIAVAFLLPADLFSYQQGFLFKVHNLGGMQEFGQKDFIPSFSQSFGVFSFNLEVALICLVLSVFYGAGAVFLIVFNASLFASFLFYVINYANYKLPSFILLIHFIPEIIGFLLAAVAGAVLSVAIMREHWGSNYFKNVIKNAFLMFIISLGCLFIASLLEVFVSKSVIHAII